MKRVTIYVSAVAAAAVLSASLLPWNTVVEMPWSALEGLIVMCLLGILSERLTVDTSIGKSGSTNSVAYLPMLATVLLFGPAAVVLFLGVIHSAGDFLLRRKPAIKGIFNVSQHVLAASLAGFAFFAMGGLPAASRGLAVPDQAVTYSWIPLLAYGGIYLVANHALVARVVSLASGAGFLAVWRQVVGRGGSNFVYDLLASPVAIAIALMGVELGALGLALAGLPLLAIRNSYLVAFRLQQANRDLLSALVKAIETRDPYTSGHSLRVANLCVLVARRMSLSQRATEEIEQSALLHDVGKIDAAYTEILRKSGPLTDHERVVIESHVTKGVELLETLSSVPKSVIGNVLYHHERWDGRGYPEQLAGQDIPLGARIIGVCDAVDAMLSDRPYRKALDLNTVREELRRYSGIQFDPGVARALIESNALEEHLASIGPSVGSGQAESGLGLPSVSLIRQTQSA
jgi:putative nucleotidyltransferase with HDIG domain